jgi:predicted nucleic acid-binding protein
VSLVLDSSVTLSWYFEDERTPETAALLHQVAQVGAVVPALWCLEVANGLQMAVRRGRITTDYRDASLGDLGSLAITTDPETSHHAWEATVRLADRFRLAVYDAVYLELAQRRHLPLATLDCPLRAAAGALSIDLLGLP